LDAKDDFYDEDDEILGEFLIEDEQDDLTLILMPKLEYDLEKDLDEYYKMLKRCKTKDEIKEVLRHFYSKIYNIAILQNEIDYLQARAKDLELSIKIMKGQL